MNRRYLIGAIIIVIFLGIAFFSLVKTDIEYADFTQAKQKAGKKVQVKGQWVRDRGSNYYINNNEFIFFLKDQNQQEVKVIFKGSKPNNFDIASHIIATGKFEGDSFYASEILTKCPSKYEGQKYFPEK
jgi:cytochrome c-type biogenesis protein CcmE